MTTIELDRPVKKSENCSAGTALTVRPQPRYAPALPSRIATRVPQRDWGHFPERRRVYNPWEHKVTTCIGAICQDGSGERIIMCSDTRVGIEGFASADVGVKLHIPHQGIAAMIAGTIARGRELLSVYGKHMAEGTALTALTVRDEMKVPPQIQKRKLIEEYLANTWAVSYGEYVDGKLGNLPPDVLSDIAKTVSGINLQCSLILGLFLGKTPFLFTVDESGAVLQADAFACIGSGWSIAQANMYRRLSGVNYFFGLTTTISPYQRQLPFDS